MKRFVLVFLLCLPLPLAAAPPDWLKLPQVVVPAPTPPTPTPVPIGNPKLTGSRYYIVEATKPVIVLGSPIGVLKMHDLKGPISYPAKYVLGGGDSMTPITFNGPQVFVFEPLKTGKEELIFIPVGVEKVEQIFRQMVECEIAPQPPPVPPIPPPPPDEFTAAMQTAYTADASPTKADDKAALAAVYRAVADQVSTFATAEQFYTVLTGARQARIGERLPVIRKLCGTELGKHMPADPAATMTPELKGMARGQLVRYATILEGVK